MLSKEGKFSAGWFLTSLAVLLVIIIDKLCSKCSKVLGTPRNIWWFSPFYCILLIIYLRLKYTGYLFQVSIRSVFLGTVFSFGVVVIVYSTVEWSLFGFYMCVMSFFHYSEFLAISWCNPKTLSLSSFLLNHSPQYNIAAVSSWIEFALEMYFIPEIKQFRKLSYIGLALCVIGEALRKTAMVTGSTNFDHIVQTTKNDKHKLITHGIYGIFRHPSYVGWFYWSIGTQILLLNPLCVVGYTVASWRFFKERIILEEHALLYFFGEEYLEYQKKVGTGLPGIRGCLIDE